jgi:hypothetical protein
VAVLDLARPRVLLVVDLGLALDLVVVADILEPGGVGVADVGEVVLAADPLLAVIDGILFVVGEGGAG